MTFNALNKPLPASVKSAFAKAEKKAEEEPRDGGCVTFQFARGRAGRPRTPSSDIERRRARYRDLRTRLPISQIELAKLLGQHPAHVRDYPNGRAPTDQTMDIMKAEILRIARHHAGDDFPALDVARD